MAMNRPSIVHRRLRRPVTVSRRRSASTLSSPRTSSTAVFVWISIFGLRQRPLDHDLAAPGTRRAGGAGGPCVAKRVRKVASSSAVSPPPTTAISLSRKKNPSHVAQALHAAAAQARLALETEPQRRRPGGDDDRLAAIFRRRAPRAGTAASRSRRARCRRRRCCVPKRSACSRNCGHQLRPLDAVREARVVLDVARDHQLAARCRAGEHDRLEVGPRRHRSRRSGRPDPEPTMMTFDSVRPSPPAPCVDRARRPARVGAGCPWRSGPPNDIG